MRIFVNNLPLATRGNEIFCSRALTQPGLFSWLNTKKIPDPRFLNRLTDFQNYHVF